MWQEISRELEMLIGIAISLVLGFLIGYERKLRRKEASIGTHTIVCMGSALFVIVSKFGFGSQADSARVAAQVVSGIGFWGAGIIMYRQNEIHGLTTAAGMWATAAIGMACGAGLYFVAVCSTLLLIGIRCIFHLPVKIFQRKHFYRIYIVFYQQDDGEAKIKSLFNVQHFLKYEIKREEDGVYCSVIIDTAMEFTADKLGAIMKENQFIKSIKREDEI